MTCMSRSIRTQVSGERSMSNISYKANNDPIKHRKSTFRNKQEESYKKDNFALDEAL